MIATGSRDGASRLHRRIVASFSCRPDPQEEQKSRALAFPLVIDLPGWKAMERAVDQITITDDVTGNLTLRAVPAHVEVDLAVVLPPLFQAAGLGDGLKIGAAVNGRIPLELVEDGQTMIGWAQLFPCPTAKAMVIALAVDAAGADALHAKLESARCLGEGEPAQTWPDAPPAQDPAAAPPPP
jgi:hypothetical protein